MVDLGPLTIKNYVLCTREKTMFYKKTTGDSMTTFNVTSDINEATVFHSLEDIPARLGLTIHSVVITLQPITSVKRRGDEKSLVEPTERVAETSLEKHLSTMIGLKNPNRNTGRRYVDPDCASCYHGNCKVH